jgi:hypothetical protein
MPRNDNEDRADFMQRHGLVAASWDNDGNLISATRSMTAPRPQQQAEAPAGPAAKLAKAFQERLKRDNEVRFAATHFRPRIETPTTAPTDDVPRAVRAREASRGRPSPKQPNR